MSTAAATQALIQNLDRVVNEVLTYFAGPGKATRAMVDRWQARDILQHFLYFHDATAWGIQSVAVGGPAWTLPADSDTINEVCRRLHEHESIDELITQLRLAHARLTRAARSAPDLDRPCFVRTSGEAMTGRQRLELLARHWREHVEALQAAAAKT
ncbi:MAG: hypothetical protein L0027_03630 [Candidatus Rokubacteria bacterium]|nr:hypothetical protein [Candidatus Rokubacteria bacterium]